MKGAAWLLGPKVRHVGWGRKAVGSTAARVQLHNTNVQDTLPRTVRVCEGV